MRFWLPAALLLLLEAISFAATACPGCQEIASAPPSGIFVLVRDSQESNRSLEIVAYYENESASPRRQPLRDSILIVEITNSTGLEVLRKTYTDANGTAAFSFTGWDKSCLNFKVLYCPYCLPADSDCAGFRQCLNFSHIESGAANAGEIEDAADANDDGKLDLTEAYVVRVDVM